MLLLSFGPGATTKIDGTQSVAIGRKRLWASFLLSVVSLPDYAHHNLILTAYLSRYARTKDYSTSSSLSPSVVSLTDPMEEEIVCKVRTQQAENFDEEVKSLVSAWFPLSQSFVSL